MTEYLPACQKAIFGYIEQLLAERPYPPSIREIGKAFGIVSSTVHQHLGALARKGFIRMTRGRSRSIEILKQPSHGATQPGIPILGRIAAGRPLLAGEHVEAHLSLSQPEGGGSPFYALRVVGDSMIGVGIMPGDFVIARYQETADDGDIVVARLGNEATVKRLRRSGKEWILRAENEAYEPILIRGEDIRIQGRVIAVHRVLAKAR